MQTYKFIIKGFVQGVCYRKSVCDNAINQNYTGSIKNLANGDVEAIANLDSSNFDYFVQLLKQGSSYSKVSSVTSSKVNSQIYKNFSIKY